MVVKGGGKEILYNKKIFYNKNLSFLNDFVFLLMSLTNISYLFFFLIPHPYLGEQES